MTTCYINRMLNIFSCNISSSSFRDYFFLPEKDAISTYLCRIVKMFIHARANFGRKDVINPYGISHNNLGADRSKATRDCNFASAYSKCLPNIPLAASTL